jgi:hypothetical protein
MKIAVLFVVFLVAFVVGISYWGPAFGWIGGPGLCTERPCSGAVTYRPDPYETMRWATYGALAVVGLAAVLIRLVWKR